jgi:hypothetical protein
VTEAEWLAATDPAPMLSFLRGKAGDRKLRLFACACCSRVAPLLRSEQSRLALRWAEWLAEGQGDDGRRREVCDGARAVLMAEMEAHHAPEAAPGGRFAPTAAAMAVFLACEGPGVAVQMGLPVKDVTDLAGACAGWCANAVGWDADSRPRSEVERPVTLRSFWKAASLSVRAFPRSGGPVLRRLVTSLTVAAASLREPWSDLAEQAERAEAAQQALLLRELFGNPFRPCGVGPGVFVWNDGTVPKLAWSLYCEKDFGCSPVLADAAEDAGCGDPELLGHLRGPGPHVRGCWALDLLLGQS